MGYGSSSALFYGWCLDCRYRRAADIFCALLRFVAVFQLTVDAESPRWTPSVGLSGRVGSITPRR